MNNTIHIFTGSRKDFEDYLSENIDYDNKTLYFMQLIQDYNANLRQEHRYTHGVVDVENLIVKADDYASVYEHVVQNFITIITTNHNIENTFIHNPPQRVIRALESEFSDNIVTSKTEYNEISEGDLKKIWDKMNDIIVGQDNSKKSVLYNLYKQCNGDRTKPVVIMFYGPSGVGKTETAKAISEYLGGKLLRIQFSMMQTLEANNYVFGAEHSKSSLAKDLMARETNIVLIDEFDKVHPNYYNAFYQMFDEGVFVDTNYVVQLKNCIFICTTNFHSEDDIKEKLGLPIFSRFDDFIQFRFLSIEEKETILNDAYSSYIESLDKDKKAFIQQTDILDWHKKNLSKFDNVRIINNSVERAINKTIIDKYIL